MKGQSAKQKGKILEDHIADSIVAMGLDPKARRDGASGAGNREKGDIITSLMVLGQNIGIEAKNQKTIHIPEWWRQVKRLESLGREPVLAFKQYGEPMDDTKVVIYLDTFLRLLKLVEGKEESVEEDQTQAGRDKRYKLERARIALTEALKVL